MVTTTTTASFRPHQSNTTSIINNAMNQYNNNKKNNDNEEGAQAILKFASDAKAHNKLASQGFNNHPQDKSASSASSHGTASTNEGGNASESDGGKAVAFFGQPKDGVNETQRVRRKISFESLASLKRSQDTTTYNKNLAAAIANANATSREALNQANVSNVLFNMANTPARREITETNSGSTSSLSTTAGSEVAGNYYEDNAAMSMQDFPPGCYGNNNNQNSQGISGNLELLSALLKNAGAPAANNAGAASMYFNNFNNQSNNGQSSSDLDVLMQLVAAIQQNSNKSPAVPPPAPVQQPPAQLLQQMLMASLLGGYNDQAPIARPYNTDNQLSKLLQLSSEYQQIDQALNAFRSAPSSGMLNNNNYNNTKQSTSFAEPVKPTSNMHAALAAMLGNSGLQGTSNVAASAAPVGSLYPTVSPYKPSVTNQQTAMNNNSSLSPTYGVSASASSTSSSPQRPPVLEHKASVVSESTPSYAKSEVYVAPKQPRGRYAKFFPDKLHRLLLEAEDNGDDDIVCFTPSGDGFVVKKPEEFITKLSGRHFKFSSFSSFRRQLYLYSFEHTQEGQSYDVFQHPNFLKERPDLLKLVRR